MSTKDEDSEKLERILESIYSSYEKYVCSLDRVNPYMTKPTLRQYLDAVKSYIKTINFYDEVCEKINTHKRK